MELKFDYKDYYCIIRNDKKYTYKIFIGINKDSKVLEKVILATIKVIDKDILKDDIFWKTENIKLKKENPYTDPESNGDWIWFSLTHYFIKSNPKLVISVIIDITKYFNSVKEEVYSIKLRGSYPSYPKYNAFTTIVLGEILCSSDERLSYYEKDISFFKLKDRECDSYAFYKNSLQIGYVELKFGKLHCSLINRDLTEINILPINPSMAYFASKEDEQHYLRLLTNIISFALRKNDIEEIEHYNAKYYNIANLSVQELESIFNFGSLKKIFDEYDCEKIEILMERWTKL